MIGLLSISRTLNNKWSSPRCRTCCRERVRSWLEVWQ